MLYDPGFAEAVRRAPESVGVAPEVAALLRTVDPRALAADPQRRRRTLGALVEELRASTAIALDETRSLAFVEGFFAAREFHAAVEERTPLVYAYGAFLDGACARGALRNPRLRDVIALELAQARSRREAKDVARNPD